MNNNDLAKLPPLIDRKLFFADPQITNAQLSNDPRVKKAESDQIVVALRELGRQVQYLVALNEGHGFRREDNRLAVATAIESFFARYLDGRAQESVSPEVKARLEALTVDVEDVTAPQQPSMTEAGQSPLRFIARLVDWVSRA